MDRGGRGGVGATGARGAGYHIFGGEESSRVEMGEARGASIGGVGADAQVPPSAAAAARARSAVETLAWGWVRERTLYGARKP